MVDSYQPQLLFMPDLFLLAIKVVASNVHKVNKPHLVDKRDNVVQPGVSAKPTVGWDKQPLGETSNMYIYI